MNRKVSRERTTRNIKQTPLKSLSVFNLRVNLILWDLELPDFPIGTFKKVGRVRTGALARPTVLNLFTLFMRLYIQLLFRENNKKLNKQWPVGTLLGKARPVLLFLKEHET